MGKIKHSKFRNTGFLFELLVRQLTSDILAGKESLAESVIKEFFSTKTELGKEYQLYNRLMKEKFTTDYRADKFIDVIIEARLKLDTQKLNRQKYNLIHTIKETFDIDKIFSYPIKNYKLLASIYKVFEGYASERSVTDTYQSRNTILENLISTNADITDAKDTLIESYKKESRDLRMLSQKFLIDKFNEKYNGLDKRQKRVLQEYIGNISDNSTLRVIVEREIPYIVGELTDMKNKIEDDVTRIKLKETTKQLKAINSQSNVKDKHLTAILIGHELVKELKSDLGERING